MTSVSSIFVRGLFNSTYHQIHVKGNITTDELRRRLVDLNMYTKHQAKWMKLIGEKSMEVIANNTILANQTRVLILIPEMHPVVIAYFDDTKEYVEQPGFYAVDLYNAFLYKSTIPNLQHVAEVYDESSYCAPSNPNSLNRMFYCEYGDDAFGLKEASSYAQLPRLTRSFLDLFLMIANPTEHEVISFEHIQKIQTFETKYKNQLLTLDEWMVLFPDILNDGNRTPHLKDHDPSDWKWTIKIMCKVEDDEVTYTFEEWKNRLETFYKVTKMNELNYDLQTLQKRSCFV